MRALVTAMGECGHGVYMLTKGADTPIPFLESLAADSGRPVMVAALLHNSTNPQAVFDDLAAIAAANTRGHRLIGQVSCCPLTMDFTLQSPYPAEGLQSWQPALGRTARRSRRCSPSRASATACAPNWPRRRAFRLFNGEWDKVQVVETAHCSTAALRAALASPTSHAREDRDPLDVMLDLALAENLQTVFTAQLLNSRRRSRGPHAQPPAQPRQPERCRRAPDLLQRRRLRPASDGPLGARPQVMSMDEAVRRLTSQPAQVFGMQPRGMIREGYAADLLLFDPQTVGRGPKRRVRPAGGRAA